MKKIFFALSLMLAFTINANAQESKVNVQELAKKESAELAQLVGLSESQTTDFKQLFEMKHQTLSSQQLSAERRAELTNIMDRKIRASITPEQMKKLEANTELYDKLISKSVKK
jgi:hypothetical protein